MSGKGGTCTRESFGCTYTKMSTYCYLCYDFRKKVYGYEDSNLKVQSSEFYFIPDKDEIVITNTSEDALMVEVCYPSQFTSSGYRTLWFATDDILPLSEILLDTTITDERKETFRYMDDGDSLTHYGSMDRGNEYTDWGKLDTGHTANIYSNYAEERYNNDVRFKLALIK